jgi:outer membrane receptor protein involved in Fe transport
VTSNNPNVRPLNDAFFDDITRGYKQKAAFLSVDVDLIPKVLTLTGGTRYYDIEDFEKGSNVGSFGCEINGPYNGAVPPNPCVSTPATGVLSNLNNLDAKHLDKTYKGWKSRGNLTWHVLPDARGRKASGRAGSTVRNPSSSPARPSTVCLFRRSPMTRIP